jgi:hypothetical protein
MSLISCKIKIIDEVYATISGLLVEDQKKLYEMYGFFVDGHKYIPAVQLGRWDGKKRYFDKYGKTYVRLLHEIIPELVNLGYDIIVEDQRKYTPPMEKKIDASYLAANGITLRPYQYDTVNALLANSGGIARIATRWRQKLHMCSIGKNVQLRRLQSNCHCSIF